MLNRLPRQFRYQAVRPYSVLSKLKDAKAFVDTVADDRTDISKKTLKYVRRIGVLSIFVAVGSVIWSGTMVDPILEPLEDIDLSDVRKWK